LAGLVREHDLGFVVAPGDVDSFIAAVRTLSHDPARATAMGRRGRELYEAQFAPEIAFANWERILRSVDS
jgi:glycosyltransferase involved in cell wall biosynthesis